MPLDNFHYRKNFDSLKRNKPSPQLEIEHLWIGDIPIQGLHASNIFWNTYTEIMPGFAKFASFVYSMWYSVLEKPPQPAGLYLTALIGGGGGTVYSCIRVLLKSVVSKEFEKKSVDEYMNIDPS